MSSACEGPTRVATRHGDLLDRVVRAAHDRASFADLPREAISLYIALGMVDSPPEDLEPAIAASRDASGAFDLARFFASGFRSIHPHWPLRMLSNAHVAPICEERRTADVLAQQAGLAPSTAADEAGVGSASAGHRPAAPGAGADPTSAGVTGA